MKSVLLVPFDNAFHPYKLHNFQSRILTRVQGVSYTEPQDCTIFFGFNGGFILPIKSSEIKRLIVFRLPPIFWQVRLRSIDEPIELNPWIELDLVRLKFRSIFFF